MKKKLVTILLIIVATIAYGYLFFLSWLLGFLVSRYAAGKSDGERGKVKSIVIPFRRWGFHFHHWLYSLCLVGFSSVTGIHFLSPAITYGLLGGLVFQGIYCYSDWHIILIRGLQAKARDRQAQSLHLEGVLERRSPSKKPPPLSWGVEVIARSRSSERSEESATKQTKK